MEKRSEDMEIDLLQLAKALWHRAWAIVLAMVLFGGCACFGAAFLVTRLYQSSALLYVNNSSISVGNTTLSISPSELTAAQSLVNTYLVILKTRSTLNEVIGEADLDYTYEELKEMISAAPVNSTEVFEIVVTSDDPQEAERIANTITDVLPDKISDIVDGSSVRIVDHAVIPSKPVSPSITKYTAIGILLGFVVSCAAIIVITLFDETIRSEEYLLETYHLPLLSAIPELFPGKTGKGGYYGAYQRASKSEEEPNHAQKKSRDAASYGAE